MKVKEAKSLVSSVLARSTLTSKGQITIPVAIRAMLHLNTGDRIVWGRNEEGHLIVEPGLTNTLADIWAAIDSIDSIDSKGPAKIAKGVGDSSQGKAPQKKPQKRVTVEAMDAGIAKAMRKKYGRG